ncbi:unnamed protein product [Rhodiola kirilowii]
MADLNASDSRHVLSPVTQPPPPPIYKDTQGSENSIPLSPQWLLPKIGESKHESGNEGEYSGFAPNNAKHLDILKPSRSIEEVADSTKKKDIFRPSLLDQETGRLDRWRDEERDTNSSVRRDRWRDGDKEPSENRSTDRWTDKLASKHHGETQRPTPDRWGDSSNKDSGYERRESKWTNRWGPSDKDKDVLHEKSQEFGRVSDMVYETGLPNQSTQRNDDKEGDFYRPWRSNSSLSRGRGDSPQTLTPSKGSAFSYGRGRGENHPLPFSHTHGRPNMSTPGKIVGAPSRSSKLVLEKAENIHLESSVSRYSRAKLVDVYRTMDKQSSWELLDGFVEVPSLTQAELSEPLGLSAPSPEEAAILIGIDKGDILSSGAPVNNKEGHAERHSSEFSQSRRPKFGSREDLPHAIDGSINGGANDLKSGYSNHLEADMLDKQARHSSAQRTYQNVMPTPEDSTPPRKSRESFANRELGVQRGTYVPPGSSWRSPSLMEHARSPSLGVRDVSDDRQSSNHDFVQSQHPKESSDGHENGSAYKMYHKSEPKWHIGGRSVAETQSSVFIDRENESRKLPSPSPEDLVLLYKDPQGNIQGPFTGSDIIGWYDAGYFGIDLQVRLAAASKDQPFSLLGDVMPHLRSKARPPPGFNVPKQSDPINAPSRLSYSNSGKLILSSSEIDPLKNDLRPMRGFSTDVDSRFLESLMTGPQGYFGNNLSSVSPVGVDNADLYLMAKKRALEQKRSWTGRDPVPMIAKPEMGPETASVHPMLQSIDNIHPTPPSQNSELLAMLQGVSERSSSGFNSAASGWSNFPVQSGPVLDNLSVSHGQNMHQASAFSIQQQMLQAQNNSSLINLLSQSNHSGVLKPENISSAMPQDSQTSNMLQQQYLNYLHAQTPVPLQQLSLLDKLLLLQQQQQSEQQQQLLRQQNMLDQTLPESLPHQHPGGPSYGQMQANAILGGEIDQLQNRLAAEHLNAGMQRPALGTQTDKVIPHIPREASMLNSHFLDEARKLNLPTPQDVIKLNSPNPQESSKLSLQSPQEIKKLDPQVATDPKVLVDVNLSSEASVRLPHQFSKDPTNPKTDLYENIGELHRDETAYGSTSMDSSAPISLEPSKTTAKTFALPTESRKQSGSPAKLVEASGFVSVSLQANDMSKVSGSSDKHPTEVSNERIMERAQSIEEPNKVKEVKNVETHEVKKGAEKKSRKQKASKSTEQGKGASKTTLPPNKLSDTEGTTIHVSEGDVLSTGDDATYLQNHPGLGMSSDKKAKQTFSGYADLLKDSDGSIVMNDDKKAGGFPSQNTQSISGNRAWKPAPGFKPKSLLEIQQEEQTKAQAEVQTAAVASSSNSTTLSTPWAGVLSNADTKTSKGNFLDMGSKEVISERALNLNSSKSQLHDLLADEVNAKSNDTGMQHDYQKFTLPEPSAPDNSESTDDVDFIQAKDTKKGRKRSGKTKGASSKVISVSPDASIGSSPIEKIKSSRQVHQEKEILPAVPSGPSLGDFVVWKGESANISPSQAPAWSTDSGKVQPMSLRDILKEQKKKTPTFPTSQKPLPVQPTAHGIFPSGSLGAPSISKVPAPTQVTSLSNHSKHSGDDDLFWGPIDSSKLEAKQSASDFPQLANHSSHSIKSSTSLKGSIGGVSKQKSVAGKTLNYSLSSSPQSSLKGRKDTMSKQSEAMDFRDWCQAESDRLLGTKDTSFLEFCLKQTRSEAKILLVENLGSYDPNHEFIDKFLNYKELLPADVLDIALQSENDWKSSSVQSSFSAARIVESTPDPSIKGGGKKKSKKGKKVSPSVLGFNVVSNRIMMGEIQTVED